MRMQRHFTLFELLIAIGLLVMLTAVMLRMFVLTSDVWSGSEEQARMYADAKTAFAILADDLNNIVYQNESSCSPAGTADVTAPMWLEAYPSSGFSGQISCYNSYPANEKNYAAGMHFVTHNGFPASSSAEMYSVSYRFLPPSKNGAAWDSVYTADGTLVRSIGSPTALSRNASSAMNSLFPSNSTFATVITGVLDFKILAYPALSDAALNNANYPADLVTASGTLIPLIAGQHGVGQSDLHGAQNIETIQIVLTLIPPSRLSGLRSLTNAGERNEYLFRYARTFRKTFRIRNRVSDPED